MEHRLSDPLTEHRNDIQLRDVRDGELIVSHLRVAESRTATEVQATSTRLPLACLVLFDGEGAVPVAELDATERAWVEAETATRSNAVELEGGA
jgi:hypothetical protein